MSGSTSTAQRRSGIAQLFIDGVAMDVVSDAAWQVNNTVRTSLIGQSGYQGYSEMPTVGFISAKLRDAGNLSVKAITEMRNVDLVLVLASGKTVYGHQMVNCGAQEVGSQEAVFDVRFEGPEVYEALA